MLESLPVVLVGSSLYAGEVPVRIHIVASPEAWGTGDHADEPDIAENRPTPCFFVLYEAAGDPGEFKNIIPNLPSIEAARAEVERLFPAVTWFA